MRYLIAIFIALLFCVTCVSAFWSGTVQDQIISQDDNMLGWHTRMVVDGAGTIHVVWNERVVNYPLQQEIHYSRSGDNGRTWSAMGGDIIISYDDGINAENDSDIAAGLLNPNLYVVWGEKDPTIKEIHYSISTDGGDTWTGQTGDHILSLPGGADALNPAIAVDESDCIHVVWNQDCEGGPDEIFYSRSTDDGLTWSAERIISFPDGQAASESDITMVPESNIICVIWKEPDDSVANRAVVNVSISDDQGDTWSGTEADIPVTQSFRILSDPHVSADVYERIHVIWKGTQDESSPFHYEIYYSQSLDLGDTWSGLTQERMISYYEPGDPSVNIPNIGVDSQGSVMVVWDEDYSGDDNEIFISTSLDGGQYWSGETLDEIISFPDGHPAYRPFIVAGSDDTLHVTWNEVTTTSYYQIHYSRGDALPLASPASVFLTPENPPIQIPASGGSFNFNITVTCPYVDPITVNTHIMVQMPDSSWIGPVLGPVIHQVACGWPTVYDHTQNIPERAPAGIYLYEATVGMGHVVFDQDSFTFEKLETGEGESAASWVNESDPLEIWQIEPSQEPPTNFALLKAYPNPFNPLTIISFALPEAVKVEMTVYDISGRQVAMLVNGWREAGYHEVSFNGLNLASGVYVYRIQAGEFTAVKKMILMK